MTTEHLKLGNLQVYKMAIKISRAGWNIYNPLGWQDKKIMGDQFIRATDSIGANIAEGYGRFHYLDRIKFYYNSRGSLLEVKHWLFLLMDREKINKTIFNNFIKDLNTLHHKLNLFIRNIKKNK